MLCPAYSSPLLNLGTASGVKNLRVPVGSDPSLPVAIVTIGEFKFEKRQMGPFVLGVLQRPVFENVDVELKPNHTHEDWGHALRDFLRQATIDKKALLRKFSLRISDGPTILESRDVAFDPIGQLVDLVDVTFPCYRTGKVRSVPKAKLLLSGKESLILMLQVGVEDERIKLVPPKP